MQVAHDILSSDWGSDRDPKRRALPNSSHLNLYNNAMSISWLLSTTIFNIFDPAWLFTAVPYSFGHVFMFSKHFILVRMEVELESIPVAFCCSQSSTKETNNCEETHSRSTWFSEYSNLSLESNLELWGSNATHYTTMQSQSLPPWGPEQNCAKRPSYLNHEPCKPFAITTQSQLKPQCSYYH